MTNAHPKLRTTDRDYALSEANRLAVRTGRRHRITIEKPDVPAKGIAYLVDEVVSKGKHQGLDLVIDPYLHGLQDRVNDALQRAFLQRSERA